jgi:hypothetical protein
MGTKISMKVYFQILAAVSICSLVVLFHTGCANPTITNTPRNIVEQLLISSAVERCMVQMDIHEYKDSKVFPDYANLATQADLPFVKGQFELHLAKYGIILVKDEKEAKYTMRLISGTLATDSTQLLLGTPPLPIPLPNTSLNFSIPELAFFKRQSRSGFSKLSMTVLDSGSQKPLRVYESIMAKTLYINYTILFIPFYSDNLITVDAEDTELDLQFFE